MKIIGTAKDSFLVEISRDEIYHLIGFYWHGSDGAPKLNVGDSVRVSAMYSQLYNLKNKRKALDGVVKELRAVADNLELLKPVDLVIEAADE